ncbi:hypothetical protein AGMMS49579_16660 [Spirochaetia bacterium]|nr:hypothetical protein AGMMS49579_16660 [Spirochaetia bacterium]
MKKYKIFPPKDDKWIAGPFDTDKLEQELNAYAEQGWRVVACTSGQFFTGGHRNEIIIILEKDE